MNRYNILLLCGLVFSLSCSSLQYKYYGVAVASEAQGVVFQGPTADKDKDASYCAPFGKCVMLEKAEWFKVLNDLDEALEAARQCK